MGSGMLPCGAYVTLEHEYILIYRKGQKRSYPDSDTQALRASSAYFWEEHKRWFSDIWEIHGIEQTLVANEARSRSGAYPLEVPYRLIQMYSLQGDTVMDPFLGTGTTQLAALLSCRNSIGFEMDPGLKPILMKTLSQLRVDDANAIIKKRYDQHEEYAKEREKKGKPMKYYHKRWKSHRIQSHAIPVQCVLHPHSEPQGITFLYALNNAQQNKVEIEKLRHRKIPTLDAFETFISPQFLHDQLCYFISIQLRAFHPGGLAKTYN